MSKNYKRLFLFSAWGSILIGILARIIQLGKPEKFVFDEVYFPVFASKLLKGELAFDVHPPLGKMLITLGIWVFGDRSFGWRIVPCLFGLGLIALFAVLWRDYAHRPGRMETEQPDKEEVRFGSLLMAALVSIEGILIVYSRVGLMDGILLFFILAAFWMAARAKGQTEAFVSALFLGIAISIKWLALGAVVPIVFLFWRRGQLKQYLLALPVTILVYLGVVYAGQVIGHSPHPFSDLITWHQQVWDYHVYLTATHPWGSPWWSWPIMQRPLLMLFDTDAEGRKLVMSAIGNPFLWWFSTAAVIGSVFYLAWQRLRLKLPISRHFLTPLILGYFAFLLPWWPVKRVLFIYHYLPAYAFALLILNYWLVRLWKEYPRGLMAFFFFILVISIFFLPMVTGWPISEAYLNHHIWLSGWR